MQDQSAIMKVQKESTHSKVDASQGLAKCPYGHRPSVGRQRGLFFVPLSLSKKDKQRYN